MKRANSWQLRLEIPTAAEQDARTVAAIVHDIEQLETLEDRQLRRMQYECIMIERDRLDRQARAARRRVLWVRERAQA